MKLIGATELVSNRIVRSGDFNDLNIVWIALTSLHLSWITDISKLLEKSLPGKVRSWDNIGTFCATFSVGSVSHIIQDRIEFTQSFKLSILQSEKSGRFSQVERDRMVISKLQIKVLQIQEQKTNHISDFELGMHRRLRFQLVCRCFLVVNSYFTTSRNIKLIPKCAEHWNCDVEDTEKQSNTVCASVWNR